MIAAVRIRGRVGMSRDVKRTLALLRLDRPNHCVLLAPRPEIVGMLRAVQHYITWGEIDKTTISLLIEKRARLAGRARPDAKTIKAAIEKVSKGQLKDLGIKTVFRLSPPSKGYKSVRSMWPKGDLGYRGREINNLLKRMI